MFDAVIVPFARFVAKCRFTRLFEFHLAGDVVLIDQAAAVDADV